MQWESVFERNTERNSIDFVVNMKRFEEARYESDCLFFPHY